MIFFIAGLFFFIAILITILIVNGILETPFLSMVLFLLLMGGFFYYSGYQINIDNAALKQITNESNILFITNYTFSREVAERIDNQAEKNATCTKDVCVYAGTITENGPGYNLTLLSQQNIVFKCTVQNKCKLSSFIDHGTRYLKVLVN